MRWLLLPFLALAVIGLGLSMIVHCMALLGLPQPLGNATMSLHAGVFIVWVPTILVGIRLAGNAPRKDFWKVALRDCPRWVPVALRGLFIYAFGNFFWCIAFGYLPHSREVSNAIPLVVIRIFSGHWMLFYGVAAAMLYAAVIGKTTRYDRRCLNGHSVTPEALYCATCSMRL